MTMRVHHYGLALSDMEKGIEAMSSLGYEIGETVVDPIQKVEAVCKATAGNASSMLEDILNRRQTEIDYLNGSIVRQAKGLNIKTPTNEMLTSLIKALESNYKNQVI